MVSERKIGKKSFDETTETVYKYGEKNIRQLA